METVGIICEYNPFHNGHLYHLNKIREMYPNHIIVLIMPGPFQQRGVTSLLNKWDKTEIALENNIDLIIELPFVFACASADIFAKGAIQLLNHLKVDKLVFGSESADISMLEMVAHLSLTNKGFNEKVKYYLNKGLAYPRALSNALFELSNVTIDKPNDILAVSYIKEILESNSNIICQAIKRTNDYHSTTLENRIASATSIRKALYQNEDISLYVPNSTYKHLSVPLCFIEDYFHLLKYKILVDIDNLNQYNTVDEGIEYRIKRYINEATSLDELINLIKTKRYTYNKIQRMLTYILCSYTKKEAFENQNIRYIRLLGFSKNGQDYLHCIKKELSIPLISGYKNIKDDMLNIEFRVNAVYASIMKEPFKSTLITKEYKQKPLTKC